MGKVNFKLPVEFAEFVEPHRYKVGCGGRAGMRSWTFARLLLSFGVSRKLFILCAREYQISIKDSVLKLLDEQIEMLGLQNHYKVMRDSIVGINGTQFIFKGLHHNITEIKSTEGIDYCWVEEAENLSNESLDVLLPTIRKAGSEIWLSYNPKDVDAPVHKRFYLQRQADEILVETSYLDTLKYGWLSDEILTLAEHDKKTDIDRYDWVWLGHPRRLTKSRILADKMRVATFEPPEDVRFFHGADWGFSQDPTVFVRSWIDGRSLFIDYAEYGYGVEMQELAELAQRIPTIKHWPSKADSARPETIAYMRREGFNMNKADKPKESVEEGIVWLRSFDEIVIHERCIQFINDGRLYSYKVDKKTDEVLPVIIKAYDHGWDAIRYAYCDLILNQAGNVSDFSAEDLGL